MIQFNDIVNITYEDNTTEYNVCVSGWLVSVLNELGVINGKQVMKVEVVK